MSEISNLNVSVKLHWLSNKSMFVCDVFDLFTNRPKNK